MTASDGAGVPDLAGLDDTARDTLGHRYLDVRQRYLAGTESGLGGWLNDIVPETAAQRLREAG